MFGFFSPGVNTGSSLARNSSWLTHYSLSYCVSSFYHQSYYPTSSFCFGVFSGVVRKLPSSQTTNYWRHRWNSSANLLEAPLGLGDEKISSFSGEEVSSILVTLSKEIPSYPPPPQIWSLLRQLFNILEGEGLKIIKHILNHPSFASHVDNSTFAWEYETIWQKRSRVF